MFNKIDGLGRHIDILPRFMDLGLCHPMPKARADVGERSLKRLLTRQKAH
jgi:hypothetical protein